MATDDTQWFKTQVDDLRRRLSQLERRIELIEQRTDVGDRRKSTRAAILKMLTLEPPEFGTLGL